MLRLRLLPVTSYFCDGEQLHVGKLRGIFLLYRGRTWAVVPFSGNLLALWAVEIFEIRLRDCARALLVNDLVHHAYDWFAQDAAGGDDDFKLVLAKIVGPEKHLVFPSDQDVADTAFDKSRGCSTSA